MAIHPHILHNGQIREAASAVLRAGQIGALSGWGVFTTLRIVDGIPFAWERHWARMRYRSMCPCRPTRARSKQDCGN